MRIILIGAEGQLGSDLIRKNPGHTIIPWARRDLDLSSVGSVGSALSNIEAELVINTAAFHNVPQCEEHPELALQVNASAVRDLALACRLKGIRFFTVSTDYVFDGVKGLPYLETDCARPLQMYGISKLAGELGAQSVAPDETFIIRTCGLFGLSGAKAKGGNFIANRLSEGHAGVPVEISCEQTVSPTSTEDLSIAIYKLLAVPGVKPGVYHLVNSGSCSWYELTRAAFEFAGLKTEVRPVDRGGRSGTLRRPLYSALANERARSYGIELPDWPSAVERYVKMRAAVKAE